MKGLNPIRLDGHAIHLLSESFGACSQNVSKTRLVVIVWRELSFRRNHNILDIIYLLDQHFVGQNDISHTNFGLKKTG